MKRILTLLLVLSGFTLAVANNGTPGNTAPAPQAAQTGNRAPSVAPTAALGGVAGSLELTKRPTAAPAVTTTPVVTMPAFVLNDAPFAKPGLFKRLGMKIAKAAYKVKAFVKKMMNQTTSILIGVLVALAIVLAFAIDSTFGLVVLLVGVIIALFLVLR
jgi:hypothetical protein